MDWIQQWQSKLNKQNGVAPLVRTGGSRHTGLAALPYRNIHCVDRTAAEWKNVACATRRRRRILLRRIHFYRIGNFVSIR